MTSALERVVKKTLASAFHHVAAELERSAKKKKPKKETKPNG